MPRARVASAPRMPPGQRDNAPSNAATPPCRVPWRTYYYPALSPADSAAQGHDRVGGPAPLQFFAARRGQEYLFDWHAGGFGCWRDNVDMRCGRTVLIGVAEADVGDQSVRPRRSGAKCGTGHPRSGRAAPTSGGDGPQEKICVRHGTTRRAVGPPLHVLLIDLPHDRQPDKTKPALDRVHLVRGRSSLV